MDEILSISLNKTALEEIIQLEIQRRISELDTNVVFWDFNELKRQTKMSKPFILENFFNNADFPKFKVGAKWYMPAKEAEEYLLNWLKRQPRS